MVAVTVATVAPMLSASRRSRQIRSRFSRLKRPVSGVSMYTACQGAFISSASRRVVRISFSLKGLPLMQTSSRSATVRGPEDGAGLHVGAHLVVHPGCGAAQGKLPQGDEVAGLEEFFHGPGRLLGDVDLAFAQPLQQLVRRDVHQLDLGGQVEEDVRHGLPHRHPGDLGHHVV